ncbi:uncharacterized protein N7473_011036 [Penicillium subrubescens]|uniref:uncharacterized protein n=1 Tax=Penicillium subrubescens TaxID=1316194 RepID=UPI002544D9D4|nr:uncharacterized protein N7473_013454 [Penicillium subrubescens]XP_057005630.1 uncharacterized protein N7473_011036 [Penicillium subrubescens]KAJ5873581.1 hypothetical protein N7473_013454 [Penicillium subrubescens]KAJ5884150.1 hypothetical protein N7473_011036 [Penicillium subrubescens]
MRFHGRNLLGRVQEIVIISLEPEPEPGLLVPQPQTPYLLEVLSTHGATSDQQASNQRLVAGHCDTKTTKKKAADQQVALVQSSREYLVTTFLALVLARARIPSEIDQPDLDKGLIWAKLKRNRSGGSASKRNFPGPWAANQDIRWS